MERKLRGVEQLPDAQSELVLELEPGDLVALEPEEGVTV
jgi:hypothetical protein